MIQYPCLRNFLCVLGIVFILAACQNAVAPSPTPLPAQVAPAPTQGPPPTVSTASSGLTPQPPIVSGTSVPMVATSTSPTLSVPSSLNLKGKLLLSDYNVGILEINLSTRQIRQLFRAPDNGFAGPAVLSPDGQTFFLLYSRPRDVQSPNYGSASLYTLSGDGSGQPSPLLKQEDSSNYYFSPTWSPDGKSVYYGRLYSPFTGTPATQPTGYFLDQYALPDGPAQDLVTNTLSVRISEDGKKMFYVSVNPDTQLSNIEVANLDGSHPTGLLPGGENWIVDAFAVSPDAKTIVFSSADKSSFQSSLPWLDRLMGVQVAQAHNVPSDLFIMNVGGSPHQLTYLADSGFIMDFSPDGQSIAFTCGSGTYVIRPDGSEQTQISSAMSFGNLQWVP